MKFNNHIAALSTAIIATSSSSAYAIERSAPAAQPQEKSGKVVPAPQALIDRLENFNQNAEEANDQNPALDMPKANAFRPFLGVAGIPITEALAAQLGLENQVGIILETVARNSPASNAGLQVHDIITKLGGQDINSQDDLRKTILGNQPGKELELEFISKGVHKVVKVELGKAANVPQANNGGTGAADRLLPKGFFEKFPPEQRQKIRQMLEGNMEDPKLLQEFNRMNKRGLGRDFDRGRNKAQMFHFQFNDLIDGVKGKGISQGRLMMMDDNGSITLKSGKEGKLLELSDKQGKLQYSGPFNNEADKLKVPEEFRDRIKQLDPNHGFGKANIMSPEQLLEMLGKDLPEMPNFPQMRLRNNNGNGPGANGANNLKLQFNLNQQGNSSMTDPITGNQYKLSKTKDGLEVEALDRDNNLLFSGPYNSEFDKNTVPEDFKPHFENLKGFSNGKPLKLQFGQ